MTDYNNGYNRIYSFLASFSEKWYDVADKKGIEDGVVTINEFRSLIRDEWTDTNRFGEVPDNDIINNFFRTFDTNNSGAKNDRIQTNNGSSVSNMYAWSNEEYSKNLDNTVQKFVAINEVLNNYRPSSVLTKIIAYALKNQKVNLCYITAFLISLIKN